MEGELDRMCDEANREWLRARVVADAAMLASTGSVADSHADSPSDSHAARPDSHAPGAWPEPYDPAGDADASPDSLNAGLDRLGNHHPGEGGFGRVDRAQSMDRQGRDVPPDGREPVRDQDREAVMERPEQAGPPLSSIPALIEQIRRERDEALEQVRVLESQLAGVEALERLNEAGYEERLRVRDARVDLPPVEIEVLAWNDGYWTPAWLRADQKTLVFCDPDFGAGPIEKAPYWLPMPPPPEVKK